MARAAWSSAPRRLPAESPRTNEASTVPRAGPWTRATVPAARTVDSSDTDDRQVLVQPDERAGVNWPRATHKRAVPNAARRNDPVARVEPIDRGKEARDDYRCHDNDEERHTSAGSYPPTGISYGETLVLARPWRRHRVLRGHGPRVCPVENAVQRSCPPTMAGPRPPHRAMTTTLSRSPRGPRATRRTTGLSLTTGVRRCADRRGSTSSRIARASARSLVVRGQRTVHA
jgi:hypothetical protein